MHFISTRAGIAMAAGAAAFWLFTVFATQQSMSGAVLAATFYFTLAGASVFATIITVIVLMVRDSEKPEAAFVWPLDVPPSPEVARMSGPPLTDAEVIELSDDAFYADLLAHVPNFRDTRHPGESA